MCVADVDAMEVTKEEKKPKRTPLLPKALEGAEAEAMEVDKAATLLKPKGKGVQKSGRKVGKKAKMMLHITKNTSGKKKAKRRVANGN